MEPNCFAPCPLAVQVLPGQKFTNVQNLAFTYNITQFSQDQTIVQLYFASPGLISINKLPELLVIDILNPTCFLSKSQFLEVNQTQSLLKSLPRQSLSNQPQMSAATQAALKQGGTYVALGSAVINFLLNGLLSALLSIISSLGIIVHMFLVSLNYPVELMDFFGLLFPIVTFDVFPVSSAYEKWFRFAEIKTDHPLTSQFATVGYGSIFTINNIGSLFLMVNINLILPLTAWLLKYYKPFRCVKSVQRRIDKFADETLWCTTIGFFASNYLVISLVSYIESNDLRFGSSYNAAENFCSFVACAGMAFSLVFPVLMFLLYMSKLGYINPLSQTSQKINKMLEAYKGNNPVNFAHQIMNNPKALKVALLESESHKQFMDTYGVLIEGLKIQHQHSLITVMKPIFDILLKLLVAVSVTRLVDFPLFQIFLANFAILLNLQFLLHYLPCENKWDQIRQIFNALTYLLLNYLMFLLTNYVGYTSYPMIANVVIYLIWTNLGINVLLVFPNYVTIAIKNLKLTYKQWQYRKARIIENKLTKPAKPNSWLLEIQNQFNIEEAINAQTQAEVLRRIQGSQPSQAHLESISEESEESDSVSESESEEANNSSQQSKQHKTELSQEEFKDSEMQSSNLESEKSLELSPPKRNQQIPPIVIPMQSPSQLLLQEEEEEEINQRSNAKLIMAKTVKNSASIAELIEQTKLIFDNFRFGGINEQQKQAQNNIKYRNENTLPTLSQRLKRNVVTSEQAKERQFKNQYPHKEKVVYQQKYFEAVKAQYDKKQAQLLDRQNLQIRDMGFHQSDFTIQKSKDSIQTQLQLLNSSNILPNFENQEQVFQQIMEEEQKASASKRDVRLSIILAVQRRWAITDEWKKHMTEEQNNIRTQEYNFVRRHPAQEEFLNKCGFEKTKVWERAYHYYLKNNLTFKSKIQEQQDQFS